MNAQTILVNVATDIDPIEHLILGAKKHGECDETDHEVGDLQDLLRAAWEVMPLEVRRQFLESDAAKDAVLAMQNYEEMAKEIPYLHGNWVHLFGVGSQETLVRFVLDVAQQKIIAMQVEEGPLDGLWLNATQAMILDVQESVLNANGECLDDPDDFGLERAYVLPQWAAHAAVSQGEAFAPDQMPRERG